MASHNNTASLIHAPVGQGCSHCELGIPIDYAERSRFMVKLCLECVLRWFDGWTVTEWEANHAPLADHLGDRIEGAIAKELREGMKELLKVNA